MFLENLSSTMSTNQTQEPPKKHPIDQPTPILLQKAQPHAWASSWNPRHYLDFSSYPQFSPESFVMRALQQGMQCKQSKHVCQSVKYLKWKKQKLKACLVFLR